jgi:hypothetical protein
MPPGPRSLCAALLQTACLPPQGRHMLHRGRHLLQLLCHAMLCCACLAVPQVPCGLTISRLTCSVLTLLWPRRRSVCRQSHGWTAS